MPAFMIGHLQDVSVGPEIVDYLERIDATLKPFEGRFVLHGGAATALEGSWTGDLVILAFPDRAMADAWYRSAAYQAIMPLRTRNARSTVIVMDTVSEDHRATDILPAVRDRMG